MTLRPAPPVPHGPLSPTPTVDGTPITDVNILPAVSPKVAGKIKAAAGLHSAPAQSSAIPPAWVQPQTDKPGTERWAVKTGQDADRAKVGKNVINGENLGVGIVEATIEELVAIPRPAGLEDPKKDPPKFTAIRDGVAEV